MTDRTGLVVENLGIAFRGGSLPVVRRVSFRIVASEAAGLVGESGSGKSLTARAILGLLPRGAVTTGRIMLDGVSLLDLSPRERARMRGRRVAMIFQDPMSSLNPVLRVGEAVAQVIRSHEGVDARTAHVRVIAMLETVGHPRAAVGRFPAEFSRGQRQRICVARALAAEPDILITDEPVSALDVSVWAQILNLLLNLRGEFGSSIVFIGHDLFVVDFVGDRIAVMLGGRVIEILPVAGRLSAALHPHSRELIAVVPTIAAHAAADTEMPEAQIGGPPPPVSCPYVHRCPYRSDPRCDTEYPRLAQVGDGHYVASFCNLERAAVAAAPPGN